MKQYKQFLIVVDFNIKNTSGKSDQLNQEHKDWKKFQFYAI